MQDRACALVAKYKERNPGPEYVPRTVVTWRYVRVHSSHCMLSAAGQAHATPSPPLQPPGQPPPRAVLTPPQPRLGADGDAVALALAGLAQRKKAAVQQQANAGDLSHEKGPHQEGHGKASANTATAAACASARAAAVGILIRVWTRTAAATDGGPAHSREGRA